MKKIIAITNKGQRVVTTHETAQKNNWYVTHEVCVIACSAPISVNTNTTGEIAPKDYLPGLNGKIYQISEVKVSAQCHTCGNGSESRIGIRYYCKKHFNQLVITKPIIKTSNHQNRNQKCNCGSGKKYKNCCFLKLKKTSGHYYNSLYVQQTSKTA